MMSVIVSVRADALISKMGNAPALVRRALVVATTALSLRVQRAVAQDKLSGQALHARTGNLRRSINREVEERVDGVFATVGTNVEYAAIHEYGFNGTMSVQAHVRRSREQMRMKKSGVKPAGEVMVRAHTRKVNMPERSFLRSTLKEFEPRIRKDLRDAVLGVVK